MLRVPEPALMVDIEQARAYAMADFSGPHRHFMELYQQRMGVLHQDGAVLDLGCGSADITIRFAQAYPDCRLYGVDGADNMLFFAKQAIDTLALHERVRLIRGVIPDLQLPLRGFSAVISNSLLHHLDDPLSLWRCIEQLAPSGCSVFMMDLRRPQSEAEAQQLTQRYSRGEPEQLKRDLFNSLLAAYTPTEVESQLQAVGMALEVEAIGDRHLLICGQLP